MLILLGCLGFLQATLLPGLLFCRYYLPELRWQMLLPVSFGLSLIINYCLVLFLTLLGLYTALSLYTLFGIECLLFLWYKKRISDIDSDKTFSADNERPFLEILGYYLFIVILLAVCILSLRRVGEVFVGWDAVVSWNRWAVDWATGIFARNTWHYPQLLPIAFSIPYVFTGRTDIQFFSTAIALCFSPVALLVLFSIYGKAHSLAALITAILFFFISQRGNMAGLGWADFPVLVMTTLSVSMVIAALQEYSSSKVVSRLLALAFVFAAGAAVTKQAGLFWCLALPFCLWYRYKNKSFSFLINKRWMLCNVFIMLLIVLPWYIYTQVMIELGTAASEISYVTQDIHQGKSYLERIIRAISFKETYFVLLCITTIGLFIKKNRDFAFCGVAYYFIWASLFSYSLRNISIALLFMPLACGYVLQFFQQNNATLSYCNHVLLRIKRVGPYCFRLFNRHITCIKTNYLFAARNINIIQIVSAVFFALLLIVNSEKINYYLTNKQIEKQFSMGDRRLNEAVVRQLSMSPGYLLTEYQLINYIPGFDRQLYRQINHVTIQNIRYSMDTEKIDYLILPRNIVVAFIEAEIALNRPYLYIPLYVESSSHFYKVIRRQPAR
jgi:hypothetical protein